MLGCYKGSASNLSSVSCLVRFSCFSHAQPRACLIEIRKRFRLLYYHATLSYWSFKLVRSWRTSCSSIIGEPTF
ncbi:hypothetical protein HanRHA438_Chr14g0675111 [Helianthus annuus]|nr:hypothetical protein HanRHA438_Chr14g0675111 [Helianthus annuus]